LGANLLAKTIEALWNPLTLTHQGGAQSPFQRRGKPNKPGPNLFEKAKGAQGPPPQRGTKRKKMGGSQKNQTAPPGGKPPGARAWGENPPGKAKSGKYRPPLKNQHKKGAPFGGEKAHR